MAAGLRGECKHDSKLLEAQMKKAVRLVGIEGP